MCAHPALICACEGGDVRILVVGGDAQTADLLEQHGHITRASSGAEETFRAASRYDVVVLGPELAPARAQALCRGLRTSGVATAILLLTAEEAAAVRIAGLEAGADDCLSPPFLSDELLARLRAVARRAAGGFAGHAR